MRFIDIICKDGSRVGLTFHEFRITRGFAKVIHEELGNFAIPMEEVEKISIEIDNNEEE